VISVDRAGTPAKTAVRAVGAGVLCIVLAAAMLVVVTVSVSSAACLPTPTAGAASGTPSLPGDMRQRRITNARLIDQQAVELGLPGIATKAALMMALQESGALNLASRVNPESLWYPHDGVAPGDHTSVGIAQQQDNWGTIAERMDVTTSIAMFFTGGSPTPDGYAEPGLLDIPGWIDLPLTVAIQRVQQSAYPDAYARRDHAAETLAHQAGINLHRAGCLAPGSVEALVCAAFRGVRMLDYRPR
jgi:hypothetical protein